jgi:hypothetical protein
VSDERFADRLVAWKPRPVAALDVPLSRAVGMARPLHERVLGAATQTRSGKGEVMGLRERRREVLQEKADREERDAAPEEQWEYLARNLDKVAGMALETDFNQHGRKGWEFVAEAKGYAILKRRLPT